jgi:predicted tellurium resistance membrane protein TerC
MSLDNVLAIASIAQGRSGLIIIGLGVSIILILTSSVYIAKWMVRYPFLMTLGAGILAWTGGRMIATDSVVHQAVWLEFGVDLKDGRLWFLLSVVTTVFVLLTARRWNRGELGLEDGKDQVAVSMHGQHTGRQEVSEES